MVTNDLQDEERRKHNQKILEKLQTQTANTKMGPMPLWAIVSADGFNKKLVHCPPVDSAKEYSDEVRTFISDRLGYIPSDDTIDFVLQHSWRR